jgi:hypothetical protein
MRPRLPGCRNASKFAPSSTRTTGGAVSAELDEDSEAPHEPQATSRAEPVDNARLIENPVVPMTVRPVIKPPDSVVPGKEATCARSLQHDTGPRDSSIRRATQPFRPMNCQWILPALAVGVGGR